MKKKTKNRFVKGNKALLLRREDSQLGLFRNLHLWAYNPGMFSGLKMWPVFPSGMFLESLTGGASDGAERSGVTAAGDTPFT